MGSGVLILPDYCFGIPRTGLGRFGFLDLVLGLR